MVMIPTIKHQYINFLSQHQVTRDLLHRKEKVCFKQSTESCSNGYKFSDGIMVELSITGIVLFSQVLSTFLHIRETYLFINTLGLI